MPALAVMYESQLMIPAAAPLSTIVQAIEPEQLHAPTPCAEYDVRGLLNHMLFWGPSLIGSAAKESIAPVAESENDVDLVGVDWRQNVEKHVDATIVAWSDPQAWEGMTVFAVSPDLPAPMVGGMVVGELVVHGWDLARATGQDPSWDADVLAFLHEQVERTADQGRQMGIYGPAILVPADAPMLHRVLGLTGRDPAWAL
jgi:uncharacterized protein (TIGR03086 family)